MTEQTQTEPAPVTERPRITLDVDQLTPRDMKRARAGPLEGRNPFELLDDPIDRIVLLIWCLRSREDESFTWDQAEATPFHEVEAAGDGRPPQTPGPESAGSKPGMNGNTGNTGSKRKRPATEPAPSSSSSSA